MLCLHLAHKDGVEVGSQEGLQLLNDVLEGCVMVLKLCFVLHTYYYICAPTSSYLCTHITVSVHTHCICAHTSLYLCTHITVSVHSHHCICAHTSLYLCTHITVPVHPHHCICAHRSLYLCTHITVSVHIHQYIIYMYTCKKGSLVEIR